MAAIIPLDNWLSGKCWLLEGAPRKEYALRRREDRQDCPWRCPHFLATQSFGPINYSIFEDDIRQAVNISSICHRPKD